MAIATLTIPSEAMHRPMPLTMLLPDSGEPKAVLYLLHGFSDCHATFVQNSSLTRFCAGVPLMVVMPEAGCSFYSDTPAGQYWNYLTRELPQKLQRWFRLPEHHFVGGISMGGYGAAKWALQFPGKFEAAYLLAPVTDLAGVRTEGFRRDLDPRAPTNEQLCLEQLFPQEVAGTRDDLFFLLENQNPNLLPEFRVYAGTEDFLFSDISRFYRMLAEKTETCQWITQPGIHDWPTWEGFLQDMIFQICQRLTQEKE